MKILDIINKLDKIFPTTDALAWDFVGWQIKGNNKNININKILIAIDVTESVINEAIKNNIKLIIVHHPFIFSKNITTLTNNRWKKILQQKLLDNNINIYVLHTNFDRSPKGMGFLIAKDLELNNIKYFDDEKLCILGNYNNLTLKKVIKKVKLYFGFKKIKVLNNNLNTKINNVIIAPGAGGSIIEFLDKQIDGQEKISLIITGEMKWHQELEAKDKNINILILGHNMEEKFVDFLNDLLINEIFINDDIKIQKYFFQQSFYY